MPRRPLRYPLFSFAALLFLGIFAVASSKVRSATSRSSASPVVSATRVFAPAREVRASYGKLPLAFEPNQGQAGAGVKYVAHGDGYTLLLTPTEAILSLRGDASRAHEQSVAASPRAKEYQAKLGSSIIAMRLRFMGTNRKARIVALDELPGKSNYLIGTHPANWHIQIPTYAT